MTTHHTTTLPNTSLETDADDPYDPKRPLPAGLKKALDLIDRAASKAATKRIFEVFEDVKIQLTAIKLTEDLRKTAQAYYTRRKTQLLAYLDDPHPYGAFRDDLLDTNAWIANGVTVGRHMERLSIIPQRMRDGLQHMKPAGGALMEPHPVHTDHSVPRHLEVPRLKRQFGCSSLGAISLQHFFLRLDADETFVRQYAQEAKRRGFDSVFLELDWTSLRLEALNPDPKDALNHSVTPYEEGRTELGRFADHNTDETNESQGDDWPGTFEPVAYHKVHSDHENTPPDFTHPWIERLRSCPRELLPTFFKEAFQAQHTQQWNQALSGAFWLERQIQVKKKASAFVQWALEQLERIHTPIDLARHSKLIYGHKSKFTSSEKQLFWDAYNERKTTLALPTATAAA